MNNPMLEKLKNPKNAFFFVIRAMLAVAANSAAFGFFSDGLILTGLLFFVLCIQFLFDGESFKEAFKINRNLFVFGILILCVVINYNEVYEFVRS